jgi:hypothetical protein
MDLYIHIILKWNGINIAQNDNEKKYLRYAFIGFSSLTDPFEKLKFIFYGLGGVPILFKNRPKARFAWEFKQ